MHVASNLEDIGITQEMIDRWCRKNRFHAALYLGVVLVICAVMVLAWTWFGTRYGSGLDSVFAIVLLSVLVVVSIALWALFGRQADETDYGLPSLPEVCNFFVVLGPIYLIPILIRNIITGENKVSIWPY